MRSARSLMTLIVVTFPLWMVACDEGIDDWNSSARLVGYVYSDPAHATGLRGVKVILESDPEAANPYMGPDRWTETDQRGYFEGHVFLGNQNGQYAYTADMSVAYFYLNKFFRWSGGVTVGPGSTFTLPAVDTTMFVSMGGGQ